MSDYSSQTPPPQGPPEGRRRLYRSTTDRMLGGVAGGLAKFLDVDVSMVRVGFLIAAFFGLGGVILYAVMWAVVPEEGKTTSIASDALKSSPWASSGQDHTGN